MSEALFEGELAELKGAGEQAFQVHRNWNVRVTIDAISLHQKINHPPLDKIYFDDIAWIVYRDEAESGAHIHLLRENDDWAREQSKQLESESLMTTAFTIGTSLYGFQRGRQYIFKAPTILQRQLWVLSIRNLTNERACRSPIVRSKIACFRHHLTLIYLNPRKGHIMAVITILNFVETLAHQQLSSGSNIADDLNRSLMNIESLFAFAFFIEVAAYFATGMARSLGRWIDGLLTIASMALTFIPNNSPALEYFQVQYI